MQRLLRPLLLAIDRSATLLDLRDRAARAMSDGFDGVEWGLPDGYEQLQPAISSLDTMHIRAVALRCEIIDVPSAVQLVSAQLQAASSLGAKVINLSIPPVRRGSGSVGFTRYQDALNFAYELLHRVHFEAEAAGVNVALEAASCECLQSPVELRELIDAVNSSAVGVCLDVERIAALGSPLDWIDTLHRRILAVRYKNVPCSEGIAAAESPKVPINTLAQALDGVASDCPLILSHIAEKSEFAAKRCDG